MHHRTDHREQPPRRRGINLASVLLMIIAPGLGIALILPHLGHSAAKAREAALVTELARLRDAIERYAAEHDGAFPGQQGDGSNSAGSPEAARRQLILYSRTDGVVSGTFDADRGFVFGPYVHGDLPGVPVGVHQGNPTFRICDDVLKADPAVPAGWAYHPATGRIIANNDRTDHTGRRTYDQY